MILDLHRQGAGVSAIARRTGLDRKTVRKVIATGLEPPVYGPRQPRVTRLQPFESYLRERLAAVPELTALREHADLLAQSRPSSQATHSDAPPRRRGRPPKSTASSALAA
jgi:transposase